MRFYCAYSFTNQCWHARRHVRATGARYVRGWCARIKSGSLVARICGYFNRHRYKGARFRALRSVGASPSGAALPQPIDLPLLSDSHSFFDTQGFRF